MTPAAEKHPPAERADQLRAEIEQVRRAGSALEADETVREARDALEEALAELRAVPDAGDPRHGNLSTRVENAKRRYRQATSAVAAVAEQQAAQLRPELRRAEADAAREIGVLAAKVTEDAKARAAADPRTVEDVAGDFDQLRAGLCRILLDDDPDLRAVVEAARGVPVGRGEFVAVAIGGVSERGVDRRPITTICTMRDVAGATIVLPLDRLERLPEGVTGR